jgi:Carboxypeptidase regulatory-like domain
MGRLRLAGSRVTPWVLLACCALRALGQDVAPPAARITLTVVDENGLGVSGAQIALLEPGQAEVRISSDFAGRCTFVLQKPAPYSLRIQRPGFYEAVTSVTDVQLRDLRVVLYHEQIVVQQVSVTASPPGIDTTQTSDMLTMNLQEIINVPYPTSRDIRNLLPFFPSVVQDESGQVHVVGSETWATLDTLDSFDIRSPVSGNLAMRVSADAVRSIDKESTR